MEKELDIIHLIRKMRKVEALFKVMLSKQERQMLLFVRHNLLGAKKKGEKVKKMPHEHMNILLESNPTSRVIAHVFSSDSFDEESEREERKEGPDLGESKEISFLNRTRDLQDEEKSQVFNDSNVKFKQVHSMNMEKSALHSGGNRAKASK